jgi:hypothetical protein
MCESGYVDFHMWELMWTIPEDCWFLHELLCCFNHVIIVVCSVYIAKYGSDMTRAVLSREHADSVGGVLCSISQGL